MRALSWTIGIRLSQTETLGATENDVPMFRQSAFCMAVSNASKVVKATAHEATLTNDGDGSAAGVERLVLPRGGG